MATDVYSYTSKKLKAGSQYAFGETYSVGKAPSTVYTIDTEEEAASRQYPTGTLSPTQRKHITGFLKGITQDDNVEIDVSRRAIHTIGSWTTPNKQILVTCMMVQPNIANGTVHLQGISAAAVHSHSSIIFPTTDGKGPSISTPNHNPQIQGKYAILLADSLIEHGLVRFDKVSWSLLVLSQTQPIFIVSSPDGMYECKLTHDSCRLLDENAPERVGVSHSRSTSQSFSFRSKNHSIGGGSGPSITIHRSGTLQYQGKPQHAYIVGNCFKQCLDATMHSASSGRFIRSLGIIKKLSS